MFALIVMHKTVLGIATTLLLAAVSPAVAGNGGSHGVYGGGWAAVAGTAAAGTVVGMVAGTGTITEGGSVRA